MKRVMFASLIFFVGASMSETAHAQGTLYLSSLSGSSTGNRPIGSDSWWAQGFFTGPNSSGYTLNSVELLMAAATGAPTNLAVSLYSLDFNAGPRDDLADLEGSRNPTSAGTYSFTGSEASLAPNTLYAIVLTAETSTSAGAFRWRTAGEESLQWSDGWAFSALYYDSNDGLNWSYHRLAFFQTAIYATAVPEPTAGVLFGLGVAGLGFWRQQKRLTFKQ